MDSPQRAACSRGSPVSPDERAILAISRLCGGRAAAARIERLYLRTFYDFLGSRGEQTAGLRERVATTPTATHARPCRRSFRSVATSATRAAAPRSRPIGAE